MSPTTFIIADPHHARRADCLRLLLPEQSIRFVADARDGAEVISAVAKHKPRILLLDLNLSLDRGGALLPILRRKSPCTRVILLGGRSSDSRILKALFAGASGYLDEKALATFLAKAVQVVDAGEAWVSRKIVAKIVQRLARLAVQRAYRVKQAKTVAGTARLLKSSRRK